MAHTSPMVVLSLLLLLATTASAAVDLVVDGKPAATIVIQQAALDAEPMVVRRAGSGTPAQKIRLAAEELQHYIRKISGATVPIVAAEQPVNGTVILVGASAATDAVAGLHIPSGLTKPRDDEGSVVHCGPGVLVLAGNDDGAFHGTHNAVSIFLETLGVRWIMPGEFGEIVPTQTNISCPTMDRLERPTFRMRTWWCNEPPDIGAIHALWRLRNRMQIDDTRVIGIAGDSWLRKYLPDPAMLEQQPDLFARQFNQQPEPHMPNLSNPQSALIAADKIVAELEARREQGDHLDSIGFAPDDGMPMDHTPQTMTTLNQGFTEFVGHDGDPRGLSTTEEWMTYMNRIAQAVDKRLPGTIITTNGYANRNSPPEGITLHPNIGVMYASIWADAIKPMSPTGNWHSRLRYAQVKRWSQLSSYVHIYEYMNNMLVTLQTPIPQVRKLFEDYRLYAEWGVIGFFNEACLPWMEEGILTRYSRAKLMWNANLDYESHVSDFYEKWYGPTGPPMRAFWDEIEQCLLSSPMLGHEDRILPYVYTSGLLDSLERHVAAAEKSATGEPYATRVQVDRLLLEHLKLYMALHEAEFDARYADCVRHLASMHDIRLKLHAISPFLVMPPADTGIERYYSGEWYYGVLQRRDHFQTLAHMIDGTKGYLIALADRHAGFKLDPAGIGKDIRWHAPEHDRRDWRDIDTTRPFYLQGYMSDDGIPYVGRMWYVFEVDVPADAAGKTVRLYSPIVNCEAWVWINGQYIGHRPLLDGYIRPAPLDFDVTSQIVPGQKNTIGVWVSTGRSPSQVPEGFMGRLFLWSPRGNP